MDRPDNQYTTLSSAVNALQKQGYSDELICTGQGLFNHHEHALEADRFTIDPVHRLQGPGDPADMSTVYAVRSSYYGLKGLLVSAFGTYATGCVHKMVQGVPEHEREGNSRTMRPISSRGWTIRT